MYRHLAPLILLAGCGAHVPTKPEAIVGRSMAMLQAESPAVGISMVDGKTVGGVWRGRPREVELAPGEHTITAFYAYGPNGLPISVYNFKLTVEAGRFYRIKDKFVSRFLWSGASLWIVDHGWASSVGEIVASRNEPVTPVTPVFRQSNFFTFAPPQDEGWFALDRHSQGLVLKKDGAQNGETYVIWITVFELPAIETAEEFLAHVKKQRQRKEPDAARFENLDEEVIAHEGRADFCARYRHLALDKSPTTAAPPTDPLSSIGRAVTNAVAKRRMTIYSVGYMCRLPNNKNLGIALEYSNRTFEGGKDEGMAGRAEKAFAALAF